MRRSGVPFIRGADQGDAQERRAIYPRSRSGQCAGAASPVTQGSDKVRAGLAVRMAGGMLTNVIAQPMSAGVEWIARFEHFNAAQERHETSE